VTDNSAQTLYVILRHEGVAEPHFDLMIQTAPGSPLSTWRLAAWPPPARAAAQKLPDHRVAYLTFEGEISGGRGRVRRVEQGTCRVQSVPAGFDVVLMPQPADRKLTLRLRPVSGDEWDYQSNSEF
jgi:hypothetical protein